MNSHLDHKIFAIQMSSPYKQIAEKAQVTSSNNRINVPLKDTENTIFIYGIVDSSFSLSKKSLWIATGNWSMNLKNNTPAFDLNMTWYNNNASTSRTYQIFDFKPFYTEIGQSPNNILKTNGTTSISLNNHTQYHIPITIDIERNKIMTIYYNDELFNRHFGNQSLHGIVTSVIIKNKSNIAEQKPPLVINNQINQKPVDSLQKNLFSTPGILPNNTNNSSKSVKNEISNGHENITTAAAAAAATTPTTTTNPATPTNPKSVIIPENAGLLGNPSYSPQITKINEGDKLLVVNNDKNYHTVTSISDENTTNPQIGIFFDSGIINPQKNVIVDTSKLKPGNYQFECSIHPFMKGTLIVG